LIGFVQSRQIKKAFKGKTTGKAMPFELINLLTALIILFIGVGAATLTSKIVKKVIHELEIDRVLREQAGVRIPAEEFITRFSRYVVYFIAIIMALNQIGLTTTLLQIILVIVFAIIVIFIILAFKDFVPNVVAGFMIYRKNRFKEGDYIKVKDIEGKVVHVNLVETRIKTKGKDIVYIPNSMLSREIIRIKN